MSLLRPHQIKPASWLHGLLTRVVSAVDLSDTGVGKTFVAAAVANRLNIPTLVVCPKIAISAWHRAAEHFGTCFSVTNYELLRTGRTVYGTWKNMPEGNKPPPNFICQSCQRPVDLGNWEPCYTHPLGIHCIAAKKTEWNYGQFNFNSRVKFIIFDEVHRCSGIDTLNSEMLIAARRQNIKHLGLSATAACTPLQLRALGYSLDLHTLVPRGGLGFYQWAARRGCRRDINIGPGLHWLVGEDKQRKIMADIHQKIIPGRGVRVRTKDIPGFPERVITSELYDLEENNKIDSLYREMAEPLERLKQHASTDAAPDSALTKILRARQKLELLKIPIACELARDLLAKGYSVGIFCDFRATIKELSQRLECNCIIEGGRNCDADIEAYQKNTERLILVQNAAGSACVSMQDLDGQHPRVGLVFPTFDIVVMQQLMGRFHREGGRSTCFYKVLFVANSVEEQVYKAWQTKGNNLDALNNSDMVPSL